jgi:hypothetical protein
MVIGAMMNLDGAYLFEDCTRETIIRAGTAEVGLHKRYNQHLAASKLTNPRTNKMKLY